jgi:hypothetical protein
MSAWRRNRSATFPTARSAGSGETWLASRTVDRRLNEKQATSAKDWRSAAGMFAGREFSKIVDEEGRKIRDADREEARREFGERSFSTPII